MNAPLCEKQGRPRVEHLHGTGAKISCLGPCPLRFAQRKGFFFWSPRRVQEVVTVCVVSLVAPETILAEESAKRKAHKGDHRP